jgi:hypothetical protein
LARSWAVTASANRSSVLAIFAVSDIAPEA